MGLCVCARARVASLHVHAPLSLSLSLSLCVCVCVCVVYCGGHLCNGSYGKMCREARFLEVLSDEVRGGEGDDDSDGRTSTSTSHGTSGLSALGRQQQQ